MMQDSVRIAALIVKCLTGSLSVEEKKELDDWIALSEENRLLFKRLTDKEEIRENLREYYSAMRESGIIAEKDHKIIIKNK
jgi:replicative DNA helicase